MMDYSGQVHSGGKIQKLPRLHFSQHGALLSAAATTTTFRDESTCARVETTGSGGKSAEGRKSSIRASKVLAMASMALGLFIVLSGCGTVEDNARLAKINADVEQMMKAERFEDALRISEDASFQEVRTQGDSVSMVSIYTRLARYWFYDGDDHLKSSEEFLVAFQYMTALRDTFYVEEDSVTYAFLGESQQVQHMYAHVEPLLNAELWLIAAKVSWYGTYLGNVFGLTEHADSLRKWDALAQQAIGRQENAPDLFGQLYAFQATVLEHYPRQYPPSLFLITNKAGAAWIEMPLIEYYYWQLVALLLTYMWTNRKAFKEWRFRLRQGGAGDTARPRFWDLTGAMGPN